MINIIDYIQKLKILKKIASDAFTSSPTGIIDITRIIDQKPDYYVKPAPDTREINKTIIFSDWSKGEYTSSQKKLVQDILQRMLDEKFEIYIWNNHQLERLKNINDIYQSKITPVFQDDLKRQAVKQLKKSIDEFHVLDDQEMRYLFYPDNQTLQSCVPLSAFMSTDQIANLQHYFTKNTPKGIIIHELSQNDYHGTSYILKKIFYGYFPELKTLPIYLELESIRICPKTPIEDKDVFLESLQLENLQQSYASLQNISSAEFEIPRSSENNISRIAPQFKEFIKCMPQLSRLKIQGLTFEVDIPDSIKKLDISTKISLCLNIKEVESLCLGSNYGKHHSIKLTTPSHPKLNVLHLRHIEYDPSSLPLFTELKEISLFDSILLETFTNPLIKLETLRIMELNQTNFPLLQNCPHIKLLSLDSKIPIHCPTEYQFASLETCYLGNIYVEDIQKIIGHSPKLHSLSLTNFTRKQREKIVDFDISSLKKFELASKDDNSFDLTHILERGINLEELSLKLHEVKMSKALSLPHLKSLSVWAAEYGSKTQVNLNEILKDTPNLESLFLSSSTICDTGLYNLSQLKYLTLKDVSAQTPLLECLVQNPKKIEYLYISNLVSLDISKFFRQDFPNLKELTLDDTIIEIEELKDFLKRHLEYKVLNTICLHQTARIARLADDIELIDLLKQFPSVRGISLAHYTSQNHESPSSRTNFQDIIDLASKPRLPKTNQMLSFDADTTPLSNISYKIKETFRALDGSALPKVNHYRFETFGQLQFGTTDEPFKLFNDEQQWDETKVPIQTEDITEYGPSNPKGYFHGRQILLASPEWQALPSLFPDEILTHFQANPNVRIEIKYSKRDNLYYVKCNETVEINFLLHHPQMAKSELPLDILELIQQFKQFEAKPLDNPPSEPKDLLNAIIEQKVGACRHRAVAFKFLMDARQIPSRIITNDCHAYVEIKYHDQWHRCELGGYPARLDIVKMLDDENDIELLDEDMDSSQIVATTQEPPSRIIRNAPMEYVSEIELQYRQQFRPERAVKVHSLNEFIFPLINGEKPKQLIHAPLQKMQKLALAIQHTAIATGHPVFYIDSPDDLVCSARIFRRKSDNFGEWHPQGGKLYDFIQATQASERPPVLVINYAKFSADDIARISNSLYDKTASADGTAIRPDTLIVGLSDPTLPTSYTGADFYSRFDKIYDFPKHLFIPPFEAFQNQLEAPSDCFEINLFGSSNWKNKLFGGWKIIDNIPIFVTGALENALTSGRAIKILNPPDDEDFEKIWKQARITGFIQTPDCCFNIPSRLNIFTEYRADLDLESVDIADTLKPEAKILNPTLVSHFFNQYQFKDGKLSQNPGYIEAFKGQTVPVLLTRDLSIETWNELLSTCKDHTVKLEIACAPNIQLPDFLSTATPIPVLESLFERPTLLNNTCIYTQDIDFTLHQLPLNEWITIDISELKMSDLIQTINGKIEGDNFIFTEKKQALHQLLENDKKVILKGNFSNQLKDELVSFIRNRALDAPGQLLLLSSTPIPGLDTYHTHQFEKLRFLENIPADIQAKIPRIEQLKFAELQTQVEYLKTHPSATSADETFKGLEKITQKIQLPPFHPETAEKDTLNFINERKQLIEEHLEHHPYVFIAGLTGVGKSRFIESELSQDNTVHIGENVESFKRWAQAPGDSRQILFIDEANLSTQQWSEFEGLFQENPGIVIDGEYHELSKNHKVIFAGNPLNYGDDRQIAPLFARHGNAVVFSPLSPAFIYEKMIKVIFNNTTIDQEKIGGILIDYYKFVTECSEKEVLITPRQVQMMAILIKHFATQYPTQDIEKMAHYYAQQIATPLVPNHKQREFKKCFAFAPQIEMESISQNPSFSDLSTTSSTFCHTPSRLPVQHQVKDFLSLQKAGINDGLNRLVLEGEAGIGKTEMIIDVLIAEGYQKGKIDHPGSTSTFYHIPASMNHKQKKDILLKAFDEGAIVLIDEINSVASMEKLLNSILDNKHPETLNKANNSGFRLIGTQNPAYYAGRNVDSPALASRTIHIQIPPYPTHEMIAILNAKGLPEEHTEPLVKAFEYMRRQAMLNTERHIPSFRDLIKKAEAIICAHKACEKISPSIQTHGNEEWEEISELSENDEYLDALENSTMDTQSPQVLFEITTHTTENPHGQNFPSTTIYAMSEIPTIESRELQRNYYEETITDQKKLTQFYNACGLVVYSPTSKEPYFFREFDNQTRAIFSTPKKNMDYINTALTIMNMIENILARGNKVQIITGDPMLAKIANDYIEYLTKHDLTCQYEISETNGRPQIKHAENIFKFIINKIDATQALVDSPWFKQALEQTPQPGPRIKHKLHF